MKTQESTALEDLTQLLGVPVVKVRRDRPAHERAGVDIVDGRWTVRPAQEHDAPGRERVARQYWRVTIRPPDGAVLCLVLTSDQIRNGRHFTGTLRGLGSTAAIDNQTGRRCLALMHRVIEEATKEKH